MSAALQPIAPQQDVLPHSYVIIKKAQLCSGCGTLHESCDLYLKTHLRTRLGAGKYVINLRPLTTPEYRLPIETIHQALTRIPFCHECVSPISVAHLKPLPSVEAPTPVRAALLDTDLARNSGPLPDPKANEVSRLRTSAVSPRKKPTLEDIFSTL